MTEQYTDTDYALDKLVVQAWMEESSNKQPFTLRKGNRCVWATQGGVHMYLYVRDGSVVNVIVD